MSGDGGGARRDAKAAPPQVLYVDAAVLVVAKPAGLVCHATRDPHRDHLEAAVARLPMAASFACAPVLHHRLDRDTSGAVVFTIDPRAHGPMTERFRERAVCKVYRLLAAASGTEPAWEVRNYLGVDAARSNAKQRRFTAVRRKGKPAVTLFERLSLGASAAYVQAMPQTGRTHQIRVHMAESAGAIAGDSVYAGAARLGGTAIPRLMLHATSLAFEHPLAGVGGFASHVDVVCPAPPDLRAAARGLGVWVPDPTR